MLVTNTLVLRLSFPLLCHYVFVCVCVCLCVFVCACVGIRVSVPGVLVLLPCACVERIRPARV
jgi:hypothetical protein